MSRLLVVATFAFGLLFLVSAEPAVAQGKITYADNVRPIFREHCFNCHNQNKATNDLALDSYERIAQGRGQRRGRSSRATRQLVPLAPRQPRQRAAHAAQPGQDRRPPSWRSSSSGSRAGP